MRRTALLAAALAMTCPVHAAEVVEIRWDGAGRFTHAARVAPGAVLEVCGDLAKGERVAWSQTSQPATDFNIHYHVDRDRAVYPARHDASTRARGEIVVEVPSGYCWMWTNRAAGPAAVRVELTSGR